MNELAPLGSYELSAPDTWASIPVLEGDPGWAQDAAALLSDGAAAQAALAARLERTHPELIADPHLLLGVWVPDRSIPDIAGLMTVDWVLPDEGQPLTLTSYRGLIDPDRRSGHTVFPPGCSDALELTFVTFALERGEQLAVDAAAVLDTLRVTLEEAPR